MTTPTEKGFRRFKKKYFKGRQGFTGLEHEECKQAYFEKCKHMKVVRIRPIA
jgi:hypothetical protein